MFRYFDIWQAKSWIKVNNCARVYRLEHNYIVRYKYLNYMFRPLWLSSGCIWNQIKTIYNMVHYIHECGVSGGRDLVCKDTHNCLPLVNQHNEDDSPWKSWMLSGGYCGFLLPGLKSPMLSLSLTCNDTCCICLAVCLAIANIKLI